MKKSILSLLVILIISAFLLTSCGDSKKDGSTGDGTTNPSVSGSTAPVTTAAPDTNEPKVELLQPSDLMSTEGLTPSPESDFEFEGGVIMKYVGNDTNVVIPDKIDGLWVNGIGSKAFAENKTIINIALPKSIGKIPKETFLNCSALKTITFSENIQTIESRAFKGCVSLTEMIISNSVSVIMESAFEGCTSLTRVRIPINVRSLPTNMFKDCSSLSIIQFEGYAPSVSEEKTFLQHTSSDLTLYYREGSHGWTSPEWNGYKTATWVSTFENAPRTNVTYEGFSFMNYDGKLSLTSYFLDESELTEATIPSVVEGYPVTEIHNGVVFESANITSVIIPASIVYIGTEAFKSTTNLKEVKFEGDAPEIPNDKIFGNIPDDFKVYYHEGTKGWDAPEWQAFTLETW